MAKAHRTHDEATVEMFRHDPDLAAEYLNSSGHGRKKEVRAIAEQVLLAI